MISVVSGPGGWSIATVDILGRVTGSVVNAGDVVPFSMVALANAGLATVGGAAANATQRRVAIPAVALDSGAVGAIVRYRVQGTCRALVKSTANGAITADMGLCFGTVKALDSDPPAVNTNRWVARAVEAVAAGSSSTSSIRTVTLYGLTGLGINGTGT